MFDVKRFNTKRCTILVFFGAAVATIYILLVKQNRDHALHDPIKERIKDFGELELPDFYKELDRLEGTSREDFLTLTQFHPVLCPRERAELLYTLNVFSRICQEHGFTYYLLGGSMMGAYRHHGLIPWDVESDVMMNVSQRAEVLAVLGNIPGFRLRIQDRESPQGTHRFLLTKYWTTEMRFSYYSNIIGFVDIYFFGENNTHILGLTTDTRGHAWPRELVFPLSYTRFERWMLPVPACTERMLLIWYGPNSTSTCKSYYQRFGSDRYRLRNPVGTVDCSRLYSAFPFVFRQTDNGTGHVIESRKIGTRTLETLRVPAVPAVCET
ncbi:hypothetical protein BaRGS_00037472 [Batillaria attramentaria]|uniref:LicD/FKTN/FKRP nucleotidyltransferase domain-containing protein n=1 Tax=Batillaria attramentaria TaxID=370345 RepID=A0ABD0J8N8_9CAEN